MKIKKSNRKFTIIKRRFNIKNSIQSLKININQEKNIENINLIQ